MRQHKEMIWMYQARAFIARLLHRVAERLEPPLRRSRIRGNTIRQSSHGINF